MGRNQRRAAWGSHSVTTKPTACAIAGCLLISLAGCSQPKTRIDFQVYDQAGSEQPHYTDFEQCWYQFTPNGMLELAMRTQRPSTVDPTYTISQVLYLKTFWNPRPGTTFAEATQINARVQYAVLTHPAGARYDGGAFVSYSVNRSDGRLVGKIESGSLSPRYRIGSGTEPFGACHFKGTFTAVQSPREVFNTAQQLESFIQVGAQTEADR